MVAAIKGLEDFKAKTSGDKPVVVDFWATWCGPCKMIAPHFEKFSQKFTDVDFYKVDVDEEGDIAQEVGIRAMPTFIIFKNGEKVETIQGANPAKLQEAIAKVSSSA